MESQSHEHFMPCGIANPNHIASVTRQDPLSSWTEVNSKSLTKRKLFAFKKKQAKSAQDETRHWRKKRLVSFCKTKNILSFFLLFGRVIYSISYLIWLFTVLANILPGWTRSDIPCGVPTSSKVFKIFTKPFFWSWWRFGFLSSGVPACFLVFLSLNQKT